MLYRWDICEGVLRDGKTFVVDAFYHADIPAIEEIEKLCFSEPWSDASFAFSLSAPFTYCASIRSGGSLIGYCVFSLLFGEAEIQNIAIAPDARRNGAAEALLRSVLDVCHSEGCESVFLEVRQSNLPARALYEKLGFCNYGVRKDYYSKPTEDAVLMKKQY